MSGRAPRNDAPWYRHVWPWLLMLPPLASVVGGVTILVLALDSEDTLAVDDYAQIEALTAQEFARDREAHALGLHGRLTIANVGNEVELRLELDAADGYRPPDTLELRLRHATRSEFDRRLELERYADSYHARGGALPSGLYGLELLPTDGRWRLAGRMFALPAEVRLEADPGV